MAYVELFFLSLSLRVGCSTLSFCSVACRDNFNDILIVNLTFFDNGFSLIFSGCLNAVRLLSYRLEAFNVFGSWLRYEA